MTRLVLLSPIAVLLVLCAGERSAPACGGCFAPENSFTAVDSHRMVIKLGAEETILWDQFVYAGEPEDFAWVLPVPSAQVVVELASAEFVQTIDQETAPIVEPSGLPCGEADGGCGGSGGFGPPPTDGVKVYNRGVVGPYETLTIGAGDPNNLYNWLALNGYAFPASAVPTLEHYIEQNSAFVVLRLRPDKDVSAMQPVRVRFRGYMGTFPLRMVVIGATGPIDLSLWVIAEQRYQANNYPTIRIDTGALVWDWDSQTSNYDDAFGASIEAAGGRAWVTEYAGILPNSELGDALYKRARGDYLAATDGIEVPYLTRLRTRMLVDHIDDDLVLAPAEDSTDVPRLVTAGRSVNDKCGSSGTAAAAHFGGGGGGGGTLVLALGGAALVFRRRGRSQLLNRDPL